MIVSPWWNEGQGRSCQLSLWPLVFQSHAHMHHGDQPDQPIGADFEFLQPLMLVFFADGPTIHGHDETETIEHSAAISFAPGFIHFRRAAYTALPSCYCRWSS